MKAKVSLLMRKMQFIPLLALTALLSGCNLFGGAKAPSFADEGDEVKFVRFKEKYLLAQQDSELYDEESKLTDRVFKRSYSYTTRTVIKRDKSEISTQERQTIASGESQYDVNNLVGKTTAEMKTTSKSNDQEVESSSSSNEKYEFFYQFEKINNAIHLVAANTKTKQYSSYGTASSSANKESVFDRYVRYDIQSIQSPFDNYMPANASEGSDYLYYISDDVIFTYSKMKETEDNKNSVYNLYSKIAFKAQLDFTDKKQSFRCSYEIKEERTYKKNDGSFRKGDVYTFEEKTYYDYNVTAKDVTVKPVNFSDYTVSTGGNWF